VLTKDKALCVENAQIEAVVRSSALKVREKSSASFYRARYYDPSSGRFVSEDPVGFEAGADFYVYVRNGPVIFVDPRGLQMGYGRPDPSKNTIVCDGHGGIGVQFGFPGTLGGPKEQKCLMDCARVHEESHVEDALAANPKVCKGKAKGVILRFPDSALAASEIKASNAELDCLRDKLDHGCKQEGCGPIILNRIQDMEAYRNGFQKKH